MRPPRHVRRAGRADGWATPAAPAASPFGQADTVGRVALGPEVVVGGGGAVVSLLAAGVSAWYARKSLKTSQAQALSAAEQVAIGREGQVHILIDHVRAVHDPARKIVAELTRDLAPPSVMQQRVLPNISYGERAQRRAQDLTILVEQLEDRGAPSVARAYEAVQRYAAAAVGLLIRANRDAPLDSQQGEEMFVEYDELILNVRTRATAAIEAWNEWRLEVRSSRGMAE